MKKSLNARVASWFICVWVGADGCVESVFIYSFLLACVDL